MSENYVNQRGQCACWDCMEYVIWNVTKERLFETMTTDTLILYYTKQMDTNIGNLHITEYVCMPHMPTSSRYEMLRCKIELEVWHGMSKVFCGWLAYSNIFHEPNIVLFAWETVYICFV